MNENYEHLPSQEASSFVKNNVSFLFTELPSPVTAGITIVGNARANPKFAPTRYSATAAKN